MKEVNYIKILVLSCDKNEDIFYAFHHCIEKYWNSHPEIIYATETIVNPYYKTICKNEPLDKWTKRIRETLKEINDDKILLIVDDCFIRNRVDIDRIKYACNNLKGNIAMFNFEKSFDKEDEDTDLIGFKKRKHNSAYEVSLLCGLWNKNKLIEVLEGEHNPWEVEGLQNNKGYDYYINSGEYIIDFGYKSFKPTGLYKGKWCKNIVPFFKKEKIEIDYERRGFYD